MIFSKAVLNRENELVLTADGQRPKYVSLKGVKKLDIEITSDIFLTLDFIDGREPQKYQVHELDAKWVDVKSWRKTLRNKLRKKT